MKNKYNKKILVVAAHPDDEVLGCGATIARHAYAGNVVWVLVLGEGITSRKNISGEQSKNLVENLRESAERANKILGVDKLILKDFPDNKFDTVPLLEIIQIIEDIILEFKPDIVYTHHSGDVNIDHNYTYKAVQSATRPMIGAHVKQVLSFEIPSSTEWNFDKENIFSPNIFIDISEYFDKKKQALAEYKSELRNFPHPRSIEYIESLAAIRGGTSGYLKAESFELVYKRRDSQDNLSISGSGNLDIQIDNKKIGIGHPCFIVAEISANHNQNYEKAVEIIKAAAKAGADAIKLQTYTPDTMTIDSDKEWFQVGGKDNPDSWQGKTLYDLYKTAYTPWDWQPRLKKIAEDLGMMLFSTPFDETAVDFLEEMNVPCYKIASYEVNDISLLRKIARTGKPVIISLGYASLEDAELAVSTLRENGTKELAVLHCVTGYSDTPRLENMNLRTIIDIRERFGVVSGFSDNNGGVGVPIIAAAMGASIIEKHFITSRQEGGPDARFSIEPEELARMVKTIRDAEKSMGKVQYGPVNEIEEYNKRWRRSLFVVKDMKAGEEFTRENVRSIRPAFGLHTKFIDGIGRAHV